MHILALSGSPRGRLSNTRRLLDRVLEGAQAGGAGIELIDLSATHVDYCVGCGTCYVTGKCSRRDQFAPVYEKLLASDGLVLASPVYFFSVTAQLKTVIDRLADAIHCQLLLGKYACSVATAGGLEYEGTPDYMNTVLLRLGCTVVGGAGSSVSVPGALAAAEANAAALGSDLVRAFRERRTYPEQDAVHAAMREQFRQLVSFNKDTWTHEYEHWRNQGWL